MAKKDTKDKLPKELTRTAWILVVGAIAPMLDSTMVNIAVNKLMSDLNTSLNMIQWAITGYVLALAVAVPISGWMMNHLNGKKIIAWAILAFGIFSFMSGQAWNIESFIAFRAVQGFAGGIITTLLTSLLMSIAPKDKLGQLIAVVSTPVTIGPIIGPVLGGFIVQYLDWHWIFYVNVPVTIIAIFLIVKFLPDFKPLNPESRLDWFGTLLLMGLSTSLIYGIMQGSENAADFFNPQMLIFCGLGIVLIVIYVIYNAIRRNNTVLPLTFFRHRNFSAANIGIVLSGIASNGPMLLLPLFFQNIKNFSVVEAALILIPQGLGMLIARPILGKFIDKTGARPVVLVSLLITLLGTLPFIWVQSNSNLVWLAVVLFVRGLGVGGILMPLMTDIYLGIDKTDIASASVANRVIQNVGSSFGTAVISAIVTTVVSSQISSEIASKMSALKAVGTSPTTSALTALKQSAEQVVTLHAYQTGFLVASVVVVIIAIPALFLSSNKAKKK